ncbi:MAG: cache domain-containing protein [Anaerolineae bacterium]
MLRILNRLTYFRLQYILILGFMLTAAITIGASTGLTYTVINKYLENAQDARVGRDMNLAEAFYDLKLKDIQSMAGRLAALHAVRYNLTAASRDEPLAIRALEESIDNELSNLPPSTKRFVIITDAQGLSVAGQVLAEKQHHPTLRHTNWSSLPIITTALSTNQIQSGTEVIPVKELSWVGLDEQARIPVIDTPKAAPQLFDPREGMAGLVVASAAPVLSEGQVIGSVLVGHLLNQDYTLVDRIKEVAGVDTATIFFGDWRVSTNVLDADGNRAIGTRLSEEVYNQVLVKGEEFTGPAYVVNQWYISRYRPLRDHSGQITGILYVGAKQSTFQQLVTSFLRQVAFIAILALLMAALIAIPVAYLISHPLTILAQATRQVAQGDWTVRVLGEGYQEMRILAESFNTMIENLKETQEQLVQKEKLASVGQLAAGVAHEINNPLGSVLLYADILHKETPPENVQQRADLEMIINEATRCKTIVNDLLNFSRQNEVLAQETDLNALLRELAEEVIRLELYQKVKVVQDLDPNLPVIQADPLQLRQVFLNLMNNAAEAMPEGGTLTLRTRRDPANEQVIAEVQDTGIGILPENMKKIFTPFFTTKPIGKGTGLGLAIIYGIVKMHRGQINVQSEVGKGTTFTIILQERLPIQTERADLTFVAL